MDDGLLAIIIYGQSSIVRYQLSKLFRRHIPDIRLPPIHRRHFLFVYVNTNHRESRLGKGHSQGQAHIAQANDGDGSSAVLDFGE